MGTFTNTKTGKTIYYNADPERSRPVVTTERKQEAQQRYNQYRTAAKNGADLLSIMRRSATEDRLKQEAQRGVNEILSSRTGAVIRGAAKSTASGFANTAGTALDALRQADINASQENQRARQELENARRYREMVSAGRFADGRTLEDADRERLLRLAELAEQRAGVYTESVAAQHEPLSQAVQRIQGGADRLSASSQGDIAAAKEGLGRAGQFAVDVGVAGTQLLGDILAGSVTGGGALLPMAVRSFGSSAQTARQSGADLGQQLLYGTGSAALSVATEKISNVAAPFKAAFGAGVLDDALSRLPAKLSQSAAGRTVLSAIGEGGEEVVEDLVQPLLQRITYDSGALSQYQNPEFLSDTLYDGLIGAALGGVGGAADVAVNRIGPTAAQEGAGAAAGQEMGTDAAPLRGGSDGIQDALRDTIVNEVRRPSESGKGDSTLVQRVQQAIPKIQNMKPVSNITGSELAGTGKIVDRLATFINSIGNKVNRPNFGDVLFSRGRLKSSMIGHGVGQAKIDTFAAVPAVIEHGQQIDYQRNWKGRNYDTYTFAAPITYRGQPTYLGVIVTKDSASNRYYLHEVVDANGDIIFRNNESPASTSDGTSALSGDLETVVDAGDMAAASGAADTVTDGRASQAVPASGEGTRTLNPNFIIAPGAENVNPPDALVQALLGGCRIDQSAVSDQQFDTLAGRGDMGIDAAGMIYQVNPGEHIDLRTTDSVRRRGVNAFQFDHPELQPYYRQAAEALIADADFSLQLPPGRRYERTLQGNRVQQGAQASTFLRETMDETGLSRNQIIDAAQRIIHDKGQENVAAAKSVELMLDRMLSDGYTTMYGRTVPPNEAYLAAKREIAGAVEQSAPEPLPIWDMQTADGLGAANAGSLNTAYDRLQAQSSQFHPEGANAARPVDVPVQDFAGRNVSRVASNVMGAQAIPDSVIPMIEQMVAGGELSYDRNTNNASLERARRRIQDKGFDGALEEFRSSVMDGRVSKDLSTLGQTLLNTAANNRDGRAVADILSLYQSMTTSAAQATQAASIFRRLSPEAQLYGIQRTAQNLANKISRNNQDYGGIEVDPELLTKFLEQTDQAGRDAVMGEIYQNVADQVPSTFVDKWNAWRYLSMLGNPRTHIRNVVGNVFFQPMRIVKNEVAAGIETALSAAGFNVERTKSFAASPSMYRAAWNDFNNVKDSVSGNKYNDFNNQINQRRRIFNNSILEAARKKNGDALELEDALFKRITYADTLAGYLTANGFTAQQVTDGTVPSDVLNRGRDYAAKEALKATYQDRNALSDRAVKVVNSLGVVGDAVIPFKRTPANVLARGLTYSPLGLVKSLIYDLSQVQLGNRTAAEVIDNIASGATGSMLFALGAYLFSSGLLTTAQGSDDDSKWEELLGHQGYALELPDGTSVTLDWLAPASMPFFMGAEMASAMGENGMSAEAISTAMKSVANPLLEMSMLQSLNDLLESVAYSEDKALIPMLGSAVVSYFSQAIPTLGGQLERSAEDRRMTTYTDKNSPLPTDVQYALGRASSRVPGWDYRQTPYLDAWGREEETGDELWRILNNFANPAYVSQVEVDRVEKELQRVRDATGDTGVFPDRAKRYIEVNGERKDLTAEEYTRYAKAMGQTSYQLISEGIQTAEYRNMANSEKAAYIEALYKYAAAAAKAEVSDYELDGWQKNAQTAQQDLGVSPAEYIALYQQYGSAIMSGKAYEKTIQAVQAGLTVGQYAGMKAGLDSDGNNSVSQTEAQAYLDRQDFTREQKADLWTIINKSWKRNPYA